MQLKVKPVGNQYSTAVNSEIAEVLLGASGLRIVVLTCADSSSERLELEFQFPVARGFRFLNEGDLSRYWQSGLFASGVHLFEITQGGWLQQESQVHGMVGVTSAVGTFREWFICSTDGCMNVLSVQPPLVREFK